MEEVWKDIVGYEGRYQVSNLGNVRSIVFIKNGKIHDLQLLRGRDYLLVRLYKNRHGKMCRVHRLVAEAFIDNPNNYPVVNHKNWNKHDNRAENLEWCTYSYNNWYVPSRMGKYEDWQRRKNKSGIDNERPFAKPKRILCVESGEIFESMSAAARHVHVEQSNISRAARGRQKTCAGFHWKYVDEDTKDIGTLTLAEGKITEWLSTKKIGRETYASAIFDLSDLRKMRGRVRFVVKDVDGEKKICVCASDYEIGGEL